MHFIQGNAVHPGVKGGLASELAQLFKRFQKCAGDDIFRFGAVFHLLRHAAKKCRLMLADEDLIGAAVSRNRCLNEQEFRVAGIIA